MKKRRYRKKTKNEMNKINLQQHRNEKQGEVGAEIIKEFNNYIPASILNHNFNINNYKELEYKQNELINKINNMKLENGKSKEKVLLLENKRENPIRWYHNEPELLEVVKESFRGNPVAGQKLLSVVPETKEFMEEIHKMGRSEVMAEAEKKLNEMEEDYDKLRDNYDALQESKNKMSKQIEEKEDEFRGLETLTKKQKSEFDKLLVDYTETSSKLEELKNELQDRSKEIEELNEAKRQAEKKAEDEFTIRRKKEDEINEVKKRAEEGLKQREERIKKLNDDKKRLAKT